MVDVEETVNTTDLKNYLYKRATTLFDPPLTRDDISVMVDMTLDGMTKALTEEDEDGERKMLLRGFGTLRVVQRKGRTYSVRGKEVVVGDRDTVTFKPGAELARTIKE